MARIFAIVAVTCFIWGISSTPAAADAWGCSYDKCVAYCTKVAGKYCTSYCTKRLKEKVLAKTCPAS